MHTLGPSKRQDIVITGGAGFIGSHLSAAFLAKGARVTILTRHVETPRAQQLARQGARVIPCDLSRQDGLPCLDDLPHKARVIHLAADVSVHGPGLWASNVEGTKRALEVARTIDACHLTVASSIEALGMGSDAEGPLREEAPCRPVSQYGMTKARAEEIAAEWRSGSGNPALVLRIGNIYGPGSAWLLEPCLAALLDRDAIRHAWPQLRSRRFQPLYVTDLVNGMTRAIEQDLTGLYHIAGEEQVTIEDYVRTLARLLGLSGVINELDQALADPAGALRPLAPDFAYLLMGDPAYPHRCYDNDKLCRAIGPYVRWSVIRGLASTLQWYGTLRGWGPVRTKAA